MRLLPRIGLSALIALVPSCASPGGDSAEPDGPAAISDGSGPAGDLAGRDLAGAKDLTTQPTADGGAKDQSVPQDQSVPVDQSIAKDLSVPVDLSTPPDLATPADLSIPPDLTTPPPPPDLADPCKCAKKCIVSCQLGCCFEDLPPIGKCMPNILCFGVGG